MDDLSWHLQPEQIINSNNEEESSKIACKLASDRIKDPYLIVKGHLHTDVLMSEYIRSYQNQSSWLSVEGQSLDQIFMIVRQLTY